MLTWMAKIVSLFKRNKFPDFLWSLVGNIKEDIPCGHGGLDIGKGTKKHFYPGTKVYCYPALWGDGYERVQVIGRHHGTKRMTCIIVDSKCISNWRKQKIYSPTIMKIIQKNGGGFWKSEKEIDHYFLELPFLKETNDN